MEDGEGRLLGTCTVVIERKFTHGLCKSCHMENLYLDTDQARHDTHGRLLIQEALNVAHSRQCYRADIALSDERTVACYDGIFDRKDLIQQFLFPENFLCWCYSLDHLMSSLLIGTDSNLSNLCFWSIHKIYIPLSIAVRCKRLDRYTTYRERCNFREDLRNLYHGQRSKTHQRGSEWFLNAPPPDRLTYDNFN